MKKSGAPARSSGKSACEMWLDSVKQGSGSMAAGRTKAQMAKRTPIEYWQDTLRKSGGGMSTNSATMNTFGKNKPNEKDMPYLSTSHYLRQMVGTEKTKSNGMDPTARSAKGMPAYKSPEEYYDDILELKKQIVNINNENSTMKAKMRRLEEDNLKKEREIEQLLDPGKSDELRRTLGDRKPDSGAVIHSLKQKILKLEHQVKDKESGLTKLQSDLKTTKIDEMKIQTEAFYQEVVRLQNSKAAPSQSSSKTQPAKENPAKIKALNDTILRMNEKNVRLQAENRTLKEDLEKLLEDHAQSKEQQKEYEDMNRKQLLSAISKLENRLDKQDGDSASLVSDIENRRANTSGKITLEGTLAERLDQLDKRESELLEELEKQKGVLKRVKEDRQHYRQKCDEKSNEIKALQKEIDDLHKEVNALYEKDKQPTPRASRRPSRLSRQASKESLASQDSRSTRARREEQEVERKVESFQQNRAAKSIQQGFKNMKERKRRQEEDERTNKIQHFKENRAAKRIQRGWIDHRGRKIAAEEEDAVTTIQSALRGHASRRKKLQQFEMDDDDEEEDVDEEIEEEEDEDDAATLIQSAYRGHVNRKDRLKQGRRRSRSGSNPEDSDTENAALCIQSAVRGHWARQKQLKSGSRSPRTSRPSSARQSPRSARQSPRGSARSQKLVTNGLDSEGEDEDIEEDIVSSSRQSTSRRPSSGRATPKSRASPIPRRASRPQTPVKREENDEDDDSDICF